MLKQFVGWVLLTASILVGALIFFGVIDFFPAGLLGDALGGIFRGIGWLFGTALPTLGQIILDRLRNRA
jgi:hypothetical protein